MASARTTTLLLLLAVGGWFVLLFGLIVLQQADVLSDRATSLFTIVLVVVGIAVPFAVVATFLYRRSKLDRRVAIDGKCPRCRYDLRGLPGWKEKEAVSAFGPADPGRKRPAPRIQCPECGEMAEVPPSAGLAERVG